MVDGLASGITTKWDKTGGCFGSEVCQSTSTGESVHRISLVVVYNGLLLETSSTGLVLG